MSPHESPDFPAKVYRKVYLGQRVAGALSAALIRARVSEGRNSQDLWIGMSRDLLITTL